jgi:hypothetical protein
MQNWQKDIWAAVAGSGVKPGEIMVISSGRQTGKSTYKMVVEQIIKYKDKSPDELKVIREEMKITLIHNQLRFRQMFKERYNVRNESLVLIQYFQEIWNTIKDK